MKRRCPMKTSTNRFRDMFGHSSMDKKTLSLDVIEELVRNGASPDARSDSGLTPLDIAIECGDLEQVKCFLKAGADIDRKCGSCGRYERDTLLHFAASKSLDIVTLLVEYGADINIPNRRGMTPFLIATSVGRTDIMEVLANAGAEISTRDWDGWSPLHWASWTGYEEAVVWLLEQGGPLARIDKTDRWGKTPLHLAAERGQLDVAKTLIQYGSNPRLKDNYGQTPFEIAITRGFKEITGLEY